MASSSSSQQQDINCRDIQQNFYENLGNREYDCFQATDEKYIKLKIAYNLYGRPKNEEKWNNLNEDYTAEKCYDVKQNKDIEKVFKKIKSCSKYNLDPNQVIVSFLFNCCELIKPIKRKIDDTEDIKEDKINCYPIFRVKKCTGSPIGKDCCHFIDENARVYKNWGDYLENNKIPKANMFVPKDGKYKGDSNNKVLLQIVESPACSIMEDIKLGADITTTAVSLISGGIAISSLIPAITVAPIVLTGALITGAGVGIYSMVRSSMVLHDRNIHKQSISLANNEARNCYLNIATGATSIVTTGATKAASFAVNRGIVITETAATTLLSVNVVNLTLNGCNVTNTVYSVINDIANNKKASALDIMHLTTTFLFFGNAVVNFKSAHMIYKDSQNKSISELIKSQSKNLWSKLKENFYNTDMTSPENNGQIKIINDSGDYCQTIITPNFPEKAYETSLNLLKDLLCSTDFDKLLKFGIILIKNKDNAFALCKIILSRFECIIQNLLIKIVKFLLQDVIDAASVALKKLFPNSEIIVVFFNFTIQFLKLKVSKLEIEYQSKKADSLKKLELDEEEYDETTYGGFKNIQERLYCFTKIVAMRMICENGKPQEIFFRELVAFFWDWLATKSLESFGSKKKAVASVERKKVTCSVCRGYYYTN